MARRETHPAHRGIIACSFNPGFRREAQRIHEAIGAHPALEAQLLRANRPG